MRVSLITQITLLPAMLAQRTSEAPAGSIHLSVTPTVEEGADVFSAQPGDVSCTNAELCERAAQLAADLATWYANDKQLTVRCPQVKDAPLVQPTRR